MPRYSNEEMLSTLIESDKCVLMMPAYLDYSYMCKSGGFTLEFTIERLYMTPRLVSQTTAERDII